MQVGPANVAGCDIVLKATIEALLPELQKLTTYGRTTAAIEQYWAGRAAQNAAAPTATAVTRHSPASSPAKLGANLPGGETALAHKTRQACK